MEIRAFSIAEFCKRWNVGKTFTYKEIGAGRLRLTKIGKLSRITSEAEDDWQRQLVKESPEAVEIWRHRITKQTQKNSERCSGQDDDHGDGVP